MGCDIHAHTEVKINGEWHHYGTPNLSRNYALFSRMADVRNNGDIQPIAEPRGIPEDATFVTKFDRDHWGDDGHSDSWLSGEELSELVKWVEKEHAKYSDKWWSFEHEELGYLFGNDWSVSKYPSDHPKGVEDSRIIFWFDN